MIQIKNISKAFKTRFGFHQTLKNISFDVHPLDRVGILGKNGAGKSTLINIISGHLKPDSGIIKSANMTISWPVGLVGGLHHRLTGKDNIRLISYLYDKDFSEVFSYVENFAEIGNYINEPVQTYSSGMRGRLVFALSLAIDFDCYLIDEIMATGDARFKEKCQMELFDKKIKKSFVVASHDANFMENFCNKLIILDDGDYIEVENVKQGINFYLNNILKTVDS